MAPDMQKQGYLLSAILHGVVFFLFLVDIPFLRSRPLETPPIIPIEIVSIGDITASPPKRIKQIQEVSKTKMETRKAFKEAPPSPSRPSNDVSVPLKKDSKDGIALKKKLVPEEKSSSESDVKAKKKSQKENAKDKKAIQKDDDFMSVLQAVTEVQKTAPRSQDHAVDRAFDSEHISDKLSISELDALRQQLQRWWNVPAGALHADELVVTVRVTMGPDAVVRHVEIFDEARMHKDHYFRTAAESAKRALFSPACTPLKLPKNRYDQWQTFVITFNPKELG